MTPFERKLKTEKKLASLGIVLIDNLPPIEDENDLTLKSGPEIAIRILILSYLNCVAADASLQQEVMMFLIREKLWDKVSENEKKLFHKPKLTEQEMAEIQWRGESIWLLLWAINKVEALEVTATEVNPEHIFNLLPGFFESTQDFIATASTRTPSEVVDEADLAFRLNWAMREASNRGESLPNVNESIAYERYFSLSWVIGTTEWS